ncbi:TetR/AcrR family transcriptional regulator [Kibdelosporangium persicum]|uniref:HTH-type transcriptional regulator BetI n=1 Tax=Kibdelosporangium persicum TaxID=2698649 RepID=A0ABX2EZJ2_9PSEU|nr:TetR/AcrR family transcriptional regulator [Kibdelosporangium persicum]NRN64422.1 HTH-type transcriptional regulator BetI [Kibdelosporangium persicum]
MPPVNQQRRDALADAAIAIVAREGSHRLSHRSVDDEAAVPKGTTSNYFRSRDALLDAAVKRIVQLHFDWIAELREKREGELGRAALMEILAQVLDESVTVHKDRYRAMMELWLEGTRRPELHATLVHAFTSGVHLVHEASRTDGVETSETQVHLLRVIYVGTLFSFIVLPESLRPLGAGETAMTFMNPVLTQ